ncbi:MAG: ParA family protein [Legionellales bacterium]|nr:ParA family protein [Legionellales bacterium]
MKVFVSANNKGGVGKTLVSALFAEYASKVLGYRVLYIDLDSQCNSSQRYLKMESDPLYPQGWLPPLHPDFDPTSDEDQEWDGRSSIADIFFGGGVIPYPTFISTLHIAPAHAYRLIIAEQVRRNEVTEKIHTRLKEFLSLSEVKQEYDLVVIDTAPSKGPLTVSAIKAASHIIIPSVMEIQPINGIFGMLQLWMQESLTREVGNQINLIGILPNKFDPRTTLHRDNYDDLQKNESVNKYLLSTKIHNRIIFAEADSAAANPKSIFDLPIVSQARIEALAACEFIAERVFA